jgi:hypothetical protein
MYSLHAGLRVVDDIVQIEGDRPRVIERLDDCDPDWRDYLSE